MSERELADRLALRTLVDRYAAAVDRRDADAFASLFLPAGVLAVYEDERAAAAVEYRGTRELRDVMDLLRFYARTFHLMANHLCEVDGDRASGETYCLAHHLTQDERGLTDLLMLIRYRDAYARTAAGWRFARRDVLREWTEERPAERRPLAR